MIGQFIASPADLLKIRMQSSLRQAQPRYAGVMDAFRQTLTERGWAGMWRGVGPNVVRAGLVNMGELASYDSAKRAVLSTGLVGDSLGAHVLASVVSGLVSSAVCTPADVMKTRMMSPASGVPYRGLAHCFMDTVRSEGVLALWKGFLPLWARLGPWQLVFWVSYERLRHITGMGAF
jgi:solute carrier family 25 uncoupling protein 27